MKRKLPGRLGKYVLPLFLTLLMVAPTRVQAARELSLSGAGGYFIFDSDSDIEDGPYAGVRLGYELIGMDMTDSLGFEVNLGYVSGRTSESDEKVDGLIGRLDLIYPFLPRNRLVPYMVVGGGGIFLHGGEINENRPLLNYGLGARYYLGERVAVRLDARHVMGISTTVMHNFEFSLGLTFVLQKVQLIMPVNRTEP